MLRENRHGLNDPVHKINTYYWGFGGGWNPISSASNWAKDKASDVGNAVKGAVETVGSTAGALAGKATKPIADKVVQAGDAIGNTAQKVGDALHVSDAIGSAASAVGLQDIGNSIRSGYEAGAGLNQDSAGSTDESQMLEQNSEASARGQEAAANAQAAQQAASANALQNASAGINRSRAGMLGSNAASGAQTADTGIYNTAKQQTQTTNADYLSKMKQADALDTQAKYMSKAQPLATAASALQGAGQGLMMGTMLSDEDSKKEPSDGIDDDKLNEAIARFKSLTEQLKHLKGE